MADVTAIGKNKIITVKSSDRAFGTPSNFGISLSQYNLNPKYVCWHQVALPNGFFNVNANDNSISYSITNASSQTFNITSSVTPGNYSSTTLVSALATAMNNDATAIASAPSTFFTLTYNSSNGFLTISCSTVNWNFTIPTPGQLEWIIGFRSSQSTSLVNVTSATGAAILDVRPPPNIYIRSSLVAGNYLSARGSDSIIAVVQNTMNYSQTIFQRQPSPDIDIFPVSGHLSQVNFQLVDEWGRELNMDTNQEWEISISLYQ